MHRKISSRCRIYFTTRHQRTAAVSQLEFALNVYRPTDAAAISTLFSDCMRLFSVRHLGFILHPVLSESDQINSVSRSWFYIGFPQQQQEKCTCTPCRFPPHR